MARTQEWPAPTLPTSSTKPPYRSAAEFNEIERIDFKTLDRVVLGSSGSMILNAEKRATAFHEAGHPLATVLPNGIRFTR